MSFRRHWSGEVAEAVGWIAALLLAMDAMAKAIYFVAVAALNGFSV